jgi:hypothetical protein
MGHVLGYGMILRADQQAASPDLAPMLAILSALAIARFVVGLRLTPMSGVVAAFAGALWAFLVPGWGLVPPSVAALTLILSARAIVRRSRGIVRLP